MRVVAPPVFVDFVAVGIEQVGVGMVSEVQRDFGQGVNAQFVVLVHQQDEVAGRQLRRAVGGGADMAVGFAAGDDDAGIAGEFLEIGPHSRIGAGVIGDAQLPIRINLPFDGLNGTGEEAQWRVVDRNDDRDFRQLLPPGDQPILERHCRPGTPLIDA